MTLDKKETGSIPETERRPHLWQRLQQRHLFLGDAGALFISTVANGVLGFVFWVLAGRVYPAASVGLASAAISAMFLIGNLSRLGLDFSLVLQVSKGEAPSRYFGLASASLLIVGATGALLGFVFLMQPLFAGQTRAYLNENLLISLSFVATCSLWGIGLVLDQVLLVRKRGKEVIGKNSAFAAVRVCMVVPLFLLGWQRSGPFIATSIGVVAGLLLVWLRARVLVKLRWEDIRGGFASMTSFLIGASLWNYVSALIAGLPTWLLPLLIVEQLSAEAGARFYTSWMISTLINIGPAALAGGLLTAGARHGRSSGRLLYDAYIMALLYVVPIVAGTILLAPSILGIFGREYAMESVGILRLLAAASIPYAILQINFTRFRLANRPLLLTGLSGLFSVGVLLGGYLALPLLELNGVGIAWLVSSTVVGIISTALAGTFKSDVR